MTDLLSLALLAGFASWRVAGLLHTESAFEWLRNWIGIGNDKDGYPALYPDTLWGKVFGCFWCLCTVVALPVSIACIVVAGARRAWVLPVWLAASTVAIWTEKQVMRAQSR